MNLPSIERNTQKSHTLTVSDKQSVLFHTKTAIAEPNKHADLEIEIASSFPFSAPSSSNISFILCHFSPSPGLKQSEPKRNERKEGMLEENVDEGVIRRILSLTIPSTRTSTAISGQMIARPECDAFDEILVIICPFPSSIVTVS